MIPRQLRRGSINCAKYKNKIKNVGDSKWVFRTCKSEYLMPL